MEKFDLVVIGGGAGGIFSALAAKAHNPNLRVLVLEKSKSLLSKVRVSGGGRCNVTNYCFDIPQLIQNYPRGSKELIAPFHQFAPKDTMQWFESRQVLLKVEADQRVFPITDSSQTIIDCLLTEAAKLDVEIRTRQAVEDVNFEKSEFSIKLKEQTLCCRKLIFATGSSQKGYEIVSKLGHLIQPPVASLFTFNVPNFALSSLSGVSLENVQLQIVGSPILQKGPLLITHFGFSGPAVLKLSSHLARFFHLKNYKAELKIQWICKKPEEMKQQFAFLKANKPAASLFHENPFHLPKSLWRALLEKALIASDMKINDISNKKINSLSEILQNDRYQVDGKTTHKEEFVTCGGVSLEEIDFKTMESKIVKNLYFTGEILDIDGLTGGFNFQNAWTTGHIAGVSSAR